MSKKYSLLIISFGFLVGLGGIIFSETSAGNSFFQIQKNNIVLFDYHKSPKIKESLEKDTLEIKLQNNSDLSISETKNKMYLHINTPNSEEKGEIIISQKRKEKIKKAIIPYKINYKKQKENLNISEDLIKKSIQKMPLSCEISAASDIISHLTGNIVEEDELLKILPHSMFNQIRQTQNGRTIWGNPNKGFVGYIDYYGKHKTKPTQRLMTGYGVYEQPIADIFKKYNLEVKTYNKDSFHADFRGEELLKEILHAIHDGKMVQLWGDRCTDPKYEDGQLNKGEINNHLANKGYNEKNYCTTFGENRKMYWYYQDDYGNLVKHKGFRGEHIFYLLGYTGTPDNPTHIRVWDTNSGEHIYPISEWMRKWKALDYRTIIVDNK